MTDQDCKVNASWFFLEILAEFLGQMSRMRRSFVVLKRNSSVAFPDFISTQPSANFLKTLP